jgi:hypothetical protein
MKSVNPDVVRAFTPYFLGACSVALLAIAVFGKVDSQTMPLVLQGVIAGISGSAGAISQGSQGDRSTVNADNIENVDVEK